MTDIRDARPIGEPRDDSGGFCCVAAGMHEGHDEGCPSHCPECGGKGWTEEESGVVAPNGAHEWVKEPCWTCNPNDSVLHLASEPPANTDAVLREAGYDPEEVAARSRETAMKATYHEGYRAGVMAERARIANGINALRGASEPTEPEATK